MENKHLIRVDIQCFIDNDYVSVDSESFEVDDLFLWTLSCRKWLCHFIDKNRDQFKHLCSYRFIFFLNNNNRISTNHIYYDIPWYILRLFDVFKSEICKNNRVERGKKAD